MFLFLLHILIESLAIMVSIQGYQWLKTNEARSVQYCYYMKRRVENAV